MAFPTCVPSQNEYVFFTFTKQIKTDCVSDSRAAIHVFTFLRCKVDKLAESLTQAAAALSAFQDQNSRTRVLHKAGTILKPISQIMKTCRPWNPPIAFFLVSEMCGLP